jgi:hypothetical protein
MALENEVLVTDSVLNAVTEMHAIDAAFCTQKFPARFSKTAYLQSNVPAAQKAGGPSRGVPSV